MNFRAIYILTIIISIGLNNSLDAAGQAGRRAQSPSGQEKVLVHFKVAPGNAERDLIRSLGGEVRYRYDSIPVMAVSIPFSAVDGLRHNPNVTLVEPDVVHQAIGTNFPNDPDLGSLWGLDNGGQTGGTAGADIDAPEAWFYTQGSPDTVIAVIDTGAQVGLTESSTHPDLWGNIWVNADEIAGNGVDDDGNGYIDDVHGWNFYDDAAWLFYSASEDSHGTHVAGTIGAVGNNNTGVAGVNWQASLMILKFIGPTGGYTSDAIAAIEYAAANGAKVINASWGGGGYTQALKDAIEASGCLFVAAAGNGGSDQIGDNTDLTPHYPSSYSSANIISVAATDHNDDLAYFSNFGSISVDLGAPGVSIRSTLPTSTYGNYSGTSMATPHVAGVAGLVLSIDPLLTTSQVKQVILDYTDPLSSLSGKTLTGGRLNAVGAVTGEPATPPPPPPPPSDEGTVDYASSDLFLEGTSTGNFTDTHASDDVYQVLTESETKGNPSKKRSSLDHRWQFNVTGGETVRFVVEAYRDGNPDGDDFTFQYSTDNSNFSDLFTVNSANETVYEALGLNALQGPVYIRVIDTDNTQGNGNLDTLHIDHMFFESVGAYQPPSEPPPGEVDEVYVDSVTYSTKGGKNQDKDLLFTIALRDGLGNPVGGAGLTVVLSNLDLPTNWLTSGTTEADGTATFILSNAPAGCYITGVLSITAPGYTWPEPKTTPDNQYCK